MNTLENTFQRVLWTTEDIRSSSEVSGLVDSMIVTKADPAVAKIVNAIDSGSKIQIPYVQDQLYSEPNVSDDSDVLGSVSTIVKAKVDAFVGFYNKIFGEKQIAKEIGSGISAIDAARSLLGTFWKKDIKARMLSILSGAIASNKAHNGGDSVHTDAVNGFSFDLAVDTLVKAGEQMDNFKAIVVTSGTKAKILKQNALSITKAADEIGIVREYYNGLELILDDSLPVAGGLTTTVFLREGAFTFQEVTVEMPIALVKNELSGNGGGETKLVSRFAYLLHLNGYTFNDASVAGVSPTVAELANPANWTRVVDYKQTPFVALESKS